MVRFFYAAKVWRTFKVRQTYFFTYFRIPKTKSILSMKQIASAFLTLTFASMLISIQPLHAQTADEKAKEALSKEASFDVGADEFADLQLLRYQIPGFNELSLQHTKQR